MREHSFEVRTPIQKLHIGDHAFKDGEPALAIIRHGKQETLTLIDIARLLYPPDRIVVTRDEKTLTIRTKDKAG